MHNIANILLTIQCQKDETKNLGHVIDLSGRQIVWMC